jgi:hypothetical protein
LSDFNAILTFLSDFRKKTSIVKFNENPYIRNRVTLCGQTDRET